MKIFKGPGRLIARGFFHTQMGGGRKDERGYKKSIITQYQKGLKDDNTGNTSL